MDLDTVKFLLSPEGDKLLEAAKSLEGSFLQKVTALRKHYPAPVASAALELLDLRKRAARKFSRADEMLFTREALEQSSGEGISRYTAERFRKGSRVLDLACGIGGDSIGLATCCFVTAVDSDPVRIAMAERNLAVYGLSGRVRFVCSDVTRISLEADAAFLDPSRRVGGRRVVSLSQLSPPVEFIRRMRECIPNSAVKLSPATDYAELESLGGELEFISESGECKEALVWFGDFADAERRATVLPKRATMISGPVGRIGVALPGRFLYEPDPCVIRAHLVEQLALQVGAWKLDEHIAYLSSNEPVGSPFLSAYQVTEALPFNLKALKIRLRDLGAGNVIVKKRGVPFEQREMEARLKGRGRQEFVIVLTRVSNNPWALICQALRPR